VRESQILRAERTTQRRVLRKAALCETRNQRAGRTELSHFGRSISSPGQKIVTAKRLGLEYFDATSEKELACHGVERLNRRPKKGLGFRIL
jgi:hypothetical protein